MSWSSSLAKILALAALALAFSGCKDAVPKITIGSATSPSTRVPAPVITTTKSGFAAASGVANDGVRKIKFTIGYNVTGNKSSDGSNNLRPTAAGVVNEQ